MIYPLQIQYLEVRRALWSQEGQHCWQAVLPANANTLKCRLLIDYTHTWRGCLIRKRLFIGSLIKSLHYWFLQFVNPDFMSSAWRHKPAYTYTFVDLPMGHCLTSSRSAPCGSSFYVLTGWGQSKGQEQRSQPSKRAITTPDCLWHWQEQTIRKRAQRKKNQASTPKKQAQAHTCLVSF